MKKLNSAAFFIGLVVFTASAQLKTDQKCSSPIYSGREVTRRAKITRMPDLNGMPRDARGRVVLAGVLCRTGQVTDIRIIKGLSATVDEFLVAAVSLVEFVPAELNLHSVSQRIQFEFHFSGLGEKGIEVTDATGRWVEELDIVGNRTLTAKEIFSWIKTRPGDLFNAEQIKKDLDAVLATGKFDKLSTRVLTEEAVRGGVRVIFEVAELPLIAEVKFVGLADYEQAALTEVLRERRANLEPGQPYDLVQAKLVRNALRDFLASKRQREVSVDLHVENLAANKVSLTFTITNK